MTTGIRSSVGDLPVGSVVEQKQGNRAYLIVQESPSRRSVVQTWEDGFDVANRLLDRLKSILGEMNRDMAAVNDRLTAGIHETSEKVSANQGLLDELVGRPK
jgi:hypothetical protein